MCRWLFWSCVLIRLQPRSLKWTKFEWHDSMLKSKILDPCLVDRQFQCQAERSSQTSKNLLYGVWVCVFRHFVDFYRVFSVKLIKLLVRTYIVTYYSDLWWLTTLVVPKAKDYHPVLLTDGKNIAIFWRKVCSLSKTRLYLSDKFDSRTL